MRDQLRCTVSFGPYRNTLRRKTLDAGHATTADNLDASHHATILDTMRAPCRTLPGGDNEIINRLAGSGGVVSRSTASMDRLAQHLRDVGLALPATKP